MAGNYIKYASVESKSGAWTADMLPVDSHQLIALCAPRLVFISYGIPEKGDDLWLDQYGSWQATIAAGEAFKLLGATDLGLSNGRVLFEVKGCSETVAREAMARAANKLCLRCKFLTKGDL